MKKKSFYLDESPVIINNTLPKIFFWILLPFVISEFIFYVWFFTKDSKEILYSTLPVAYVATVIQRRYKKDLEKIDEKLSIGYSDPMIIMTIFSLIFAFMSIVKLIGFHPNSGWWWIPAIIIPFFVPSYPDTDFQKRP